MKLQLEIGKALCYTPVFIINDIPADSTDFGEQGDSSPETAEDYCCGDMQFTTIPPTPAVLNKYGITIDEYLKVSSALSEGLSFGSCGWCS